MSTEGKNVNGTSTNTLRDGWMECHRIPITRRSLLRDGLLGVTGLWLADRLRLPASAHSDGAKAKSVIQIWQWGGPAQIDTFDPKPGLGNEYNGPFGNTQTTGIPGVALGEHLPLLAQMTDKYALLRSMTHGQNGHETAAYMVQTGHPAGGELVYPHMGAVVSRFLGQEGSYEGLIPPYIVLTQPQGRFSESGFLGSRYKPFATGGDPNRPRFEVEGVVAPGISDARQQSRRDLLGRLNTLAHALEGDPRLEALRKCENEAYDLILGDAGKVFDLSQEPDALRDRYGRSTFGQSCLMARRLVAQGVRFVTINYGGWDTHKEHFQDMRRRLPELDKGLSTLLQDLSDHGLLESTIVWCSGEFGRTPRVDWEPPWNGGRNHHGAVFSALVAGGGFRGGVVVGESDATASQVKDRPVYPWDLIGTMYSLLGIDPEGTVEHPHGMDVRLLPSTEDGVEAGGLLKEIV
jgi:hypothetical protein